MPDIHPAPAAVSEAKKLAPGVCQPDFAAHGATWQTLAMRLRWTDGPGVQVASSKELDGELDALMAGAAAHEPLIAHLIGESGALGLGLDPAGDGLLMFAPRDRRCPPLHGRAVGRGILGDELTFAVRGRRYDFSAACRLPAATVRCAARHFLITGELPDWVAWEPEPPLAGAHAAEGARDGR
jgi:hypothetical protein